MENLKNNKLLLILCMLTCGIASAQNPVPLWTKNYKSLVKLLQKTKNIGDCTVSLTREPSSGDSWNLNILTSQGGMQGFTIVSPKVTNGETQVDRISKDVVRYRQTDFIGWNNLLLKITGKSSNTVSGLLLNKTLPSGEVYSVGAECGDLKNL